MAWVRGTGDDRHTQDTLQRGGVGEKPVQRKGARRERGRLQDTTKTPVSIMSSRRVSYVSDF